MKKTLNLALLLSTSVLFTACPTKSDDDKIIHYFNEEIKTYVFMPVGSWWVYEDSATNELDTVTLISSENRFTNDNIEDYEVQNFVYNSTFNKNQIWGGAAAADNSYEDSYLSLGFLTSVNFHAYKKDTIILLKGELIADRIDSLTIEDNVYTEVKKFSKTKHTYNLIPEVTYYAPNVGLIRKELFNGDVWNLKEYYINN